MARTQKPKLKSNEWAIVKRLRDIGTVWKDIAFALDRPESTLRKGFKHYLEVVGLPKKQVYKSKIITAYLGRAIQQFVSENPRISLNAIRGKLMDLLKNPTKTPSKSTIRRYLNRINMVSRTLQSGPLISAKNKALRIKIAHKMLTVWAFIN